jgi:hypothetical protein
VAKERGLVGVAEDGKTQVPVTSDTNFSVVLADYFNVVAGTSTGAIVATYVASKGSKAKMLHDRDSFKEGLNAARGVKARVNKAGMPADAIVAVDAPPGSAAAAQALFMSTYEEIFPWRIPLVSKALSLVRPKYPATYGRWFRFFGKKMGIEHVLQAAFGGNDVYMSDDGVLSSSLVVTSYDLKHDRPFVFWASTKAGTSGYAALRRTLAGAKENPVISDETIGNSDLVRQEQKFRLWEVVRASTAAPTFFSTAGVHMCKSEPPTEPLQMTDGGVVANNPSMLGLNFATSEYETKFVADEKGKPSVAVLSLGCGTTSEFNHVRKRAGAFGWAVTGPIIDILQSGGGELSAAIFQELSKAWPGNKKYQSLRLQLTAGYDEHDNETLSYSEDVVKLPADGGPPTGNDIDAVKCFQRALTDADGKQLKANDVLKTMDVTGQKEQLLGLGQAIVADKHVQDKLKEFVKEYLLAEGSKPGHSAPRGAAMAMTARS